MKITSGFCSTTKSEKGSDYTGWLSNLFKNRNKDPALVKGEVQVDNSPGIWAFGVNDDGTLQINEWMQADIYNLSLARTCIHRIATEISKAEPELAIPNARVGYYVSKYPNQYQSVSQFLYQLATILLTDNNAYIIPIYDRTGIITGLWCTSVQDTSVIDIDGQLWIRYSLPDGKNAMVEYTNCAHLKRMQYHNPLSGESNEPFKKIGYLYEQNLKRSLASVNDSEASIQWIGKLNTTLVDGEQAAEERDQFTKLNFTGNRTSLLLYDSRYEKLDQVKKVFNLLQPDDIKVMQTAAYNYWGVSEAILQNKYTDSDWYAFYQSAIEPLLKQIGEGITKVIYSKNQIMNGNFVRLDKLQYSSIQSRIDVAFGTYDRGMTTMDSALDILNLPPIGGDEGKKRYIRGEYYLENQKGGNKPNEQSEKSETGNRDETNSEPDDESSERKPSQTDGV